VVKYLPSKQMSRVRFPVNAFCPLGIWLTDSTHPGAEMSASEQKEKIHLFHEMLHEAYLITQFNSSIP
jgi:hypothetical protein